MNNRKVVVAKWVGLLISDTRPILFYHNKKSKQYGYAYMHVNDRLDSLHRASTSSAWRWTASTFSLSMVAFCTDVSCGRPVSVSSCTVVFIYYSWSYLIATFLGTNSLSVLMCRRAVNQSIHIASHKASERSIALKVTVIILSKSGTHFYCKFILISAVKNQSV